MAADGQQITKVRQVTEVRAAWTETTPGQSGNYAFQLVLDNGVDEYIISTTSQDADVLLRMFERSANVTFDRERKLLKFGPLSLSAP